MDRFFVPRFGFLMVAVVATTLIWGIVLRSPDTHAHLWDELTPLYTRTAVSTVNSGTIQQGSANVAFVVPEMTFGATKTLEPGRAAYLKAGCAMCHGIDARGGVVGPSLARANPDTVERVVRKGPGGMPVYDEAHLSDADLAKLVAYLQELEVIRPDSAKIAALQRLTYDPSVPMNVLLKGKAAVRRSCGACHKSPGSDDIQKAFDSDTKAARLVADMMYETNLDFEDATAIAYYMLAIRNGANPLKEP